MRFQRIFLISLVAAYLPFLAWAGTTENITIKADGTGGTIGAAVANALYSAVAQVNGAAVASASVSVQLRENLTNATQSQYESADAAVTVTGTASGGIVQRYNILSKTLKGTEWSVEIEAVIAKYARSAETNRLRLTVLPFWIRADGPLQFRSVFMEELTNLMAQSQKFAVLDRQFEKDRQDEMTVNASQASSNEELAKLGNRLGTDLMVVGVFDDARVITHSMEVGGETVSRSEIKINLAYRVIDAPTGQIKLSDTWTYAAPGNDFGAAAKKGAAQLSREIIEALFPLTIESADGDIVYIGQGGKAFQPGQIYRVIHRGKAIRDSQTGELLGRTEEDIGSIKIVDVQPKLAKGRIVVSSIDIAANFVPGDFIVRLIPDTLPQPVAKPAGAKPAQQAGQGVQDLTKKSEKDW